MTDDGDAAERRSLGRPRDPYTLGLLIPRLVVLRQQPTRELRPGSHAQFQERVVQVRFDRADREELHRRDLLVREPVRGERGDAALGLGELVGCGTSTADTRQFVTGLVRPQLRSERLEARYGLLERLARR